MFSLKLNLQCLDTDNVVRFLFFHTKVDYWWHWEIQFVCMWLVLQTSEGWKVWLLGVEGGNCGWGKWSDFIRGSTKQTIGLTRIWRQEQWMCGGLLNMLPYMLASWGGYPSQHWTRAFLLVVALSFFDSRRRRRLHYLKGAISCEKMEIFTDSS
jgi:hypothetical protein